MNKAGWKKRALAWKKKYRVMRLRKNWWKEQTGIWEKNYKDCKKKLAECEEEPDSQPDKAIKTLTIKNGKFIVNGKATTLFGVSKREMFVAGADTFPKPINYTYAELKSALFASNINYVRGIAPLDLVYFRNEVKDYLRHGIVVEVELYDSGKPNRAYQADWQRTFNVVKDLPVFFDAHNEFMDYDRIAKVNTIVSWVVDHGGLIGAGAWGASNYGEALAETFKAVNNKYQIVTHHREWNQSSIVNDREPGKPMVWNEIHTRDNNLEATKARLRLGYELCEGVQVYSLLNFGMGKGSKFQAILDYAGGLVK